METCFIQNNMVSPHGSDNDASGSVVHNNHRSKLTNLCYQLKSHWSLLTYLLSQAQTLRVGDRRQLLFSQLLYCFLIVPQIQLGPDQDDRSGGAVVTNLREPLKKDREWQERPMWRHKITLHHLSGHGRRTCEGTGTRPLRVPRTRILAGLYFGPLLHLLNLKLSWNLSSSELRSKPCAAPVPGWCLWCHGVCRPKVIVKKCS